MKQTTLKGDFTVKEFGKAAHIPERLSQVVMNILYHMGIVERVGKKGNAYIYNLKE